MAKILIVDDYAPLRRLLEWTLTEAGHEVFEAKDGFQALSLSKGAYFDLVITDLCMPNLSGIGLLRLFRAMPDYQRTPILILTTSDSEEEREQALALGASGWVVKPFTQEHLLATIDGSLAQSGIVHRDTNRYAKVELKTGSE